MKGVWPRVHVNGRLEGAEMEWLHTNGAGAYAMSTVAMRHTRRYHGVFIAALAPPVDRFVVVSHAETSVVTAERSYRLAVQQSPDAAPTPGYRFLESFDQDPIPRWTYRLGKSRFERSLALVRGKNAVVASYTWFGKEPASIRLRPLMPMRPIHALSREHGAMTQLVRMLPGQVEIRPVAALPPILFGHAGTFLGSPDWYRRLEYPEDKLRMADGEEDLWTPGSFEMELLPGVPSYLVVAVGSMPRGSPESLMAETAQFLRGEDPGPDHPPSVRELFIAAEQFAVDQCERPTILAGYPWLTALTKDALVALPGIHLVRGRVDAAKRTLRTIAGSLVDDLATRRLRGSGVETPSVEASLWLAEGTRQLLAFVTPDDETVRTVLYPALERIFRRILRGQDGLVRLSSDGLVTSADEHVALPWLDVDTGETVPFSGPSHAIDLQALWTRGLTTLARLARAHGSRALADEAEELGGRARAAFGARFWCEKTRYPFDHLRSVDEAEGPRADASIRPNALVALDVDPSLFERWQAVAILERVKTRLLTVRGIRSLDPDQPGYRGEYEGTFEARQIAYHQGLAWTHLLGAYARASLRLTPDDFDLQEALRLRVEEARLGSNVLGQVAQFGDGEPPHRAGGCPAQATSVAELLRTLVWDLGL
ncbi:MAG TPA: glycogen debranching enzyme N-terminal domain-containing protein [Polyangiaceae bacterium]|nr:glycogen debranching enzyme N-terminal domain-containing protein [Polyangiaceae bacterium]